LLAAGIGMVGQNSQNKAANKNQENAHATAVGDVKDNTNQAVSRMDALYKNTPNPLAGMHAPTGPQQGGGGSMGGGIMGQGGQMQGQPPGTPPGGGNSQQQTLQQMIQQFLQSQGGGGGGARQTMGVQPPTAPPPAPYNGLPPAPPNPFGNPQLPVHPAIGAFPPRPPTMNF